MNPSLQTSLQTSVELLDQAVELLPPLGQNFFNRRIALCFNASPGAHVRHVLDHYLSLMRGLPGGRIDYETRARDPRLESDLDYAMAKMDEIQSWLFGRVLMNDVPLQVRAESYVPPETPAWATTTLLRELEFLQSHTIHHYAILGVMVRLAGFATTPHFGLAPSTIRFLKHQDSSSASAEDAQLPKRF